jgi:hypothetical protein
MPSKKTSKKVMILIFLINMTIVIVVIAGTLHFIYSLKIGPGLPPSKAMPNWYIPGAGKLENGQYQLSSFPKISPYCNVGKYSDGKFISVWYFDVESNFSMGEDVLYHYLEENGNLSQQELNISTELQEVVERREANDTGSETLSPHMFNITEYKSYETSGYFLIYERPFLNTREDYFIVYYGTMDTENFTEEKPALKMLIAESYYMAEEHGKIDGLKNSK